MHWLKRNMWKAGIVIAGVLLLFILMALVSVSAASAYERVSGFAGPVTVTVQATPTEDATVTALNKEKLAEEVQQLKNQNEPDLFGWLRTNAAILLSTLVIVIGGLIGLFRWFGDRRSEREKRAEERFQYAVTGLGDEKEGAKVGAAILLRTFLRPDYEQFYVQAFDLAVAHLRLRTTDPNKSEPPDSLSQALITVFQHSFLLARDRLKRHPRFLDASRIQLGNTFLAGIDLKSIWMREAFFQKAHLRQADLRGAMLRYSDFSEANLREANFSGADLHGAKLNQADLRMANLSNTDLSGANLSGADLTEANLNRSNLRNTNVEGIRSLLKTNLHGVTGLTKEQLGACKAKGAIIDEVSTVSSSPSLVIPFQPLQNNGVQAQSARLAQKGIPAPDAGGSSAASSESGPES